MSVTKVSGEPAMMLQLRRGDCRKELKLAVLLKSELEAGDS